MSNLTTNTKTKVFELGIADGARPVPMFTCAAEDPQVLQMIASKVIGTDTHTEALLELASVWDKGYNQARAQVYATVNYVESI